MTRMLREFALSTTALGSLLITGLANAQEAEGETPAAGRALEEIVITAQRREESLQDAPLSVTALTGDALRLNSVNDISRLELLTPGLQFGQSGSDARPAIRGTRTEDRSVRADPTVGYYIDEVYKPRPGQHLAPLVDIARVEVLRGPQGTLFGRNTFGGAFNIVTNKPEFDAFVWGGSVTVGDENRLAVDGYVNVPLTNNLAVRLAGTVERQDGFVDNEFDDANDLKDDEDRLARAQIRFQQGGFEAVIRARYWEAVGNGNGDFGHFGLGVPVDPETGLTSPTGEIIPVDPRRGARGRQLPTDPFTIEFDADLDRNFEEYAISGEFNYELEPVVLRSILAYQDFKGSQNNDGDFSPFPGVLERQLDESETFSAEFQVVSNWALPLEYTVGFFYLDENALGAFLQDQLFLSEQPDGMGGFESMSRLFNNGTRASLPQLTANTDAPDPDFDFIELSDIDTTSLAVFGQFSYTFFERLRLTAGGRYTRDEKEAITGFLGGNFINPTNAPGVDNTLPLPDIGPGDFNFGGTNDGPVEETFEEFTWRLAADYQLTGRNLVYASVSTGFQAGGFNTVPQADGSIGFDEQTVTAYEIGSKNRLFNSITLNVSAFYNDFEDLLTQDILDIEGGVVTVARNAGTADAWGIEAEFDWVPTERALINLRLSAGQSEFDNFAVGNDFESTGERETIEGTSLLDVSGESVPLNPDVTVGLSGQYDFPLGRFGTITPAVNFYFSGSYATSDRNYSFDEQDAYTKTDLRLVWNGPDRRWSAQAFVENLENEEVVNRTVVFGGDLILQNFNTPRTWGFRLTRAM